MPLCKPSLYLHVNFQLVLNQLYIVILLSTELPGFFLFFACKIDSFSHFICACFSKKEGDLRCTCILEIIKGSLPSSVP